LHNALDFAFLDIEVTDGKTFEIAQILERKHVPFVFVSGAPRDQLPIELRSVPFIPKPFHAAQIESALQAVLECVIPSTANRTFGTIAPQNRTNRRVRTALK
jgi:two-component SAPR family response regulator